MDSDLENKVNKVLISIYKYVNVIFQKLDFFEQKISEKSYHIDFKKYSVLVEQTVRSIYFSPSNMISIL